MVEQLLKSKYHATHLGVFIARQLTMIDGILNKAMRQVTRLLSIFPTEEVQRPLKELGLGLPHIKDRATGVEHIIRTTDKDTERGYLSHSHVFRILT